tara:strand:+ start:3505 stop:5241 length:1737 start_codon:yes stop_codon:yes gene_type:complete
MDNGGAISPSIIPGDLTDGTGLCNSSIFIDNNGDILLNLRHVHYTLYHSEFQQKYYSGWGCLAYLNPEDDISLKTGNYLCKLNPDTLFIEDFTKVDTSEHDIKPIWEFIGLEDSRVVRWDNKLYVSGVRRDVKDNGEGRMELCELSYNSEECREVSRLRIEVDPHTHLEKNWMPILDMPYHYIRWSNPLEIIKVDPTNITKQSVAEGKLDTITSQTVINKSYTIPDIRSIRGGSQVINYGDYKLAIIHECDYWINEGDTKDAEYYHRFLFWDKDWNLVKITEPFKFMDTQIEFCCGLAKKGKDLLISFGYQDNAAYILKMPNKVLDLLTYVDLDKDTKFDCKYEEFSWEFNEPYLSKIINQEIFTDNIYQKYSKVQEGDIVVDIGANVGAFSYLALKKNIKHLYSIEPSRLLLPTLIKNIGESSKVDIVNYRIGNYEEDKVVLQKDDGINIYDNANSTFDTITFTNFIEKYKIKKIDFLKCDCEGGEYSVFTEGNFDWIYNNVKKIAGEFHLWGIPDALENFYKFKNKYLIDGVTYFVEDREGNNVTSKISDNQWLEDFSWNNQGGAQLNVYIEYGRK